MKYKVAFNIYIDQEFNPNIVNHASAIKVARSLTINEIGSFDWLGDGLLFKEYLYFETESSNDTQEFCDYINEAQAKCQCPDPEFSYIQKVKNVV